MYPIKFGAGLANPRRPLAQARAAPATFFQRDMTDFSDLGLSPETLQAVKETGYTQPTPIQEQAIPVALAGRDVLGIAQTGTGKTAAFTLPMIDKLAAGRSKARMPRALVIAPTRELADQVAASFEKYAKHQKLSWALLIGGVSFEDQIKKLDRGVDVLIATPGRLLDHFERGRLLLTGVQMMVVDEADRMLDMGFIPDLERIFKMTPVQKQTLFFSATMPPEITRLTTQFLKDPTRIEASRPATTGENITQFVTRMPIGDAKAKRMVLRALIERSEVTNGIIFCNRKSEVDIVAKSLKVHGLDAAPIHGDLDQSMRTKTLESFRKGELKLLVASDVAARGLDIPAVGHVFNYDVPHHAEDYVHRIGRTGRAGRTGETFMLVTPNDVKNYEKVLKLTKKEPEEITVDIDWAEAKAAGERDTERRKTTKGARGGERDRGRSRDSRGEPRSRPVKDHGERASMEALTPAAAAEEAAPPARTERRPRRDEKRSTGDKPIVPARSSAYGEEPRAPRGDRPERRPSSDQRSETAQDYQERPARAERSSRDAKPYRDRDDNGPSVVGFGADTPAFLMRVPPSIPVKG
jgi:superfamily II DNA/RNA helicase